MRKRNLVAAISSLYSQGLALLQGRSIRRVRSRLWVPFAAGGPTDTVARIVTEPMRASLGQAVTIENITGAAGTVGTGRVAHAAPDGYTLVAGYWGTHVLNGALYTLKYDVLRDFEPIALLASNPQLIVAKNAVPANDLNELIAWLKANPNKASQGTAGMGSPAHVSGAFFQSLTGTRFQFVPYSRGAAPAMQDLIAGQIDLMFDQVSNSLPHVRSGYDQSLSVTAKTRLASAPEIRPLMRRGCPDSTSPSGPAYGHPKALRRTSSRS